MKALIILCALFSLPFFGFSQNGIEKLKQLTNTLTQQDTAKPKTTGTGSNLAVSDEGAGGVKGKSSQKTIENPIDKLKKNFTEKAVENNTSGSGTTGTGTSNLAVSDEGASGTKGKSNTREAPPTGTGTTTPTATEMQPKTGTTGTAPK